jgi:hypothetical protein
MTVLAEGKDNPLCGLAASRTVRKLENIFGINKNPEGIIGGTGHTYIIRPTRVKNSYNG